MLFRAPYSLNYIVLWFAAIAAGITSQPTLDVTPETYLDGIQVKFRSHFITKFSQCKIILTFRGGNLMIWPTSHARWRAHTYRNVRRPNDECATKISDAGEVK
jgi:hypothetical protein